MTVIPAEVFHPSEFIQDEMYARGWTRLDLAKKMTGNLLENMIALDLYFVVHARGLRMGNYVIADLALAFSVSEDFLRNLERMWISHPSSAVEMIAPSVRLVKSP